MSSSSLETFPNAEGAATAAADAIAGQLRGAGPKRLTVTGGRGPGPVYDRLANTDLDWANVTVTLSDDRFVPLAAPESNGGAKISSYRATCVSSDGGAPHADNEPKSTVRVVGLTALKTYTCTVAARNASGQ